MRKTKNIAAIHLSVELETTFTLGYTRNISPYLCLLDPKDESEPNAIILRSSYIQPLQLNVTDFFHYDRDAIMLLDLAEAEPFSYVLK